ncbi:hypothetical protein LCGC14_2290420 [marine sediment metagenome]|uniref:Uncharacterized protein n=1 Tax=marine sediment metagenome TaxID=412755 RepID=A0A0F9F3Y3_9ZZZZ
MKKWVEDPHQDAVVGWLMAGLEREQTTVENALILAYSLGILYKPQALDLRFRDP